MANVKYMIYLSKLITEKAVCVERFLYSSVTLYKISLNSSVHRGGNFRELLVCDSDCSLHAAGCFSMFLCRIIVEVKGKLQERCFVSNCVYLISFSCIGLFSFLLFLFGVLLLVDSLVK